jgi:hypothetical protein
MGRPVTATPPAIIVTVPIQMKVEFEGVIYVCYGLANEPSTGSMDLKCVDKTKARSEEQTIFEAARVLNKKAKK